ARGWRREAGSSRKKAAGECRPLAVYWRLLLRDRRVLAVVPLVDVVAGVLQIALLVEGNLTDHRAERLAVLQCRGHLARVVGSGALNAFGEGLDDRVGEQREAVRLEAALGDRRDRFLGLRLGARIGREDEHGAFAGGAGNLPEFRRGDRVRHDQLELVALLAR